MWTQRKGQRDWGVRGTRSRPQGLARPSVLPYGAWKSDTAGSPPAGPSAFPWLPGSRLARLRGARCHGRFCFPPVLLACPGKEVTRLHRLSVHVSQARPSFTHSAEMERERNVEETNLQIIKGRRERHPRGLQLPRPKRTALANIRSMRGNDLSATLLKPTGLSGRTQLCPPLPVPLGPWRAALWPAPFQLPGRLLEMCILYVRKCHPLGEAWSDAPGRSR